MVWWVFPELRHFQVQIRRGGLLLVAGGGVCHSFYRCCSCFQSRYEYAAGMAISLIPFICFTPWFPSGHVCLEFPPDARARGPGGTPQLVFLGHPHRTRRFSATKVRPVRSYAERHGHRPPLQTFRGNPVGISTSCAQNAVILIYSHVVKPREMKLDCVGDTRQYAKRCAIQHLASQVTTTVYIHLFHLLPWRIRSADLVPCLGCLKVFEAWR